GAVYRDREPLAHARPSPAAAPAGPINFRQRGPAPPPPARGALTLQVDTGRLIRRPLLRRATASRITPNGRCAGGRLRRRSRRATDVDARRCRATHASA